MLNSRILEKQYAFNVKTRKTHLPNFLDLIESILQILMKSVQYQITLGLILCQDSLKLFSRHSGNIKLSWKHYGLMNCFGTSSAAQTLSTLDRPKMNQRSFEMQTYEPWWQTWAQPQFSKQQVVYICQNRSREASNSKAAVKLLPLWIRKRLSCIWHVSGERRGLSPWANGSILKYL